MIPSHEKDTVVLKDTVIIKDSILLLTKDTVVIKDTIYLSSGKTDNNNTVEKPIQPSSSEETYFIDNRDGKKYKTTTIGKKTWMAENLNYADFDHFPKLKDNSWCYENTDSYCEENGRLYSFAVAEKACPIGWHLPDSTEFKDLINSIQKENNLPNWESVIPYIISSEGWDNISAKGNYNLSFYPTGTKNYSSSLFHGLYEETHFWTSDGKCLKIQKNYLALEFHESNYGFSVRCVKD